MMLSFRIILSLVAAIGLSLSQDTVECGTIRCFNGGTCMQGEQDGARVYHCDCTSTRATGTVFAGRYCEYEASVFCTVEEGSNVELFCVNGGTCKADPYAGCDCNDPYTGFACEYKRQGTADSQKWNGDDDLTVGENRVYADSWPEPIDPSINTGDADDYVNRNKVYTEPTGNGDSSVVYENPNYRDSTGEADSTTDDKTIVYQNPNYFPQDGNGDDGNDDGGDDDPDGVNEFGGDSGTLSPVNDIDICTIEGSNIDAAPLSFCVNGGTCLQRVTLSQGHAGCECTSKWAGPHCEISASASDAKVWSKPFSGSNSSGGKSSTTVVLIVLLTLSVSALAVMGGAMYYRSNKYKRRSNRVRWGPGYSDEPSKLNLAPRRSFAEPDYPANTHISSTRDPITLLPPSHSATSSGIAVHFAGEEKADGESQPQVYIGPPRDEDGNELHSVEIL